MDLSHLTYDDTGSMYYFDNGEYKPYNKIQNIKLDISKLNLDPNLLQAVNDEYKGYSNFEFSNNLVSPFEIRTSEDGTSFDKLNLTSLLAEFEEKISKIKTLQELEKLKTEYIGKSSPLFEILTQMNKLDPKEKKEVGSLSNTLKEKMLLKINDLSEKFKREQELVLLSKEKEDITLPSVNFSVGTKHPLNLVIEEIMTIFTELGYEMLDGHPARDMQDTFYVDQNTVLRTHCTNMTARILTDLSKNSIDKQNVAAISFGNVYRRDDDDATHSHQFMQMDAFALGDKRLFGENTEIRMRPSFFPFTEPSCEVDVTCVSCKGKGCRICKFTGFIEILGSGMLHENVLTANGIDHTKKSALAFGVGIERIAMLKFGIKNIRDFYDNDISNATPIEGTHLNFTFVDTGEDLVSPVVCGASNVKAGQFVVLIKPGQKLKHNFYKDLANIVTLETGQPTIFLDADKVGLLEITNEPTEKNPTNLVLKTNKTIISNIGVDITEEFLPTKNSKRILALYLAIDPIFMRKQQKSFNISTVSMQRYMKPISPLLSELAYKRTIYYLDNYKIIDSASELKFNKKPTIKENVIEVELKYLQDILGIDLTAKQVIDLFKTLDFEINQKGDLLSFKVDKYRTDVSIKSDIAEEVARLYGYNNIKEVAPVLTAHEKQKNLKFKITKNIEGILIGKGFNNVKTYSLINKEEANKFNLFGISDPIDLMSPLSNLRERYRLSLFSSLLEIASANSNRGNKNLKMYEFADIYNTKNLRQTRLGIISVGDYISESFRNASIQNNFAVNKTNIINILNQFNINESELTFEPIKSEISEIHPYLNAQILYKKELIGFMFKLSPRTEQSLKLQTTYIYEINISKVVELFDKNIQAHEISKFQKSSRVITLELNPSIKYSEIIKKAIKDIKYLTNISISDIYADESMLKNQTYALSLQFEFNDIEKQLVDLQISEQ
ncbi:hypothetical protein FQR65_LT16612 [Abscondita terminalis]|nr:hypothetical protein FQR65_LT16612 [Abscondita terminalis]